MSKIILEEIINKFELSKFTRFFREKNNKFAPREESYREYDEENFVKGTKLGEIVFDDTEKLVVVTFEAKQPLSERSGKRAQYEKGKKILKDKLYDAGIFIFYDPQGNFRFSLIYANYLGRRRDWSTFRRFTYFVSADPESTNKTFKQRIGDADFSTLEKIKDAFSVEKVTQSFYTDIANWYFWAVQCSTFPKGAEEEENGRNIAVIRLVTRLIFIWFMKVQGIIPEILFNKSEIKRLLINMDPNNTTYYKAILQNLFFATLNTKKNDRKYRFQNPDYWVNKDYMNHSIYRYESYFKDKNAMLEIFRDIPFLNGGLFDCLDRTSKDNNDQGEIRIDGYSDKEVGLKVPNLLFFSDMVEADLNKEYGTSNKNYHVRGLLDILQSYNFTIDENDPNDQEVALDPELLGKVFENLLASFNPETASTARKATGSYYTPREIVDYMVTESLKNYFKTSLEIEEIDEKLSNLFSVESDNNPFNQQQTLKLVQLINDLRVVDPAVGSGAFPMGILNRLVFLLGKLDPNNTAWKDTQISGIDLGVIDPILKQQLIDQVEERFATKNSDYGRKLYLIQKCIYGVDIQQIAVEIAKLRFFISLLVDEKIDKTKENWGVEPLPNLDYKIMQGNSLLEEYEGIKLFDERLLNIKLPDDTEIRQVEAEIQTLTNKIMPYYIQNPLWNRNTKIERPPELFLLESELDKLKLTNKDLLKANQFGMNNGNQIRLQFQAEEGQSQEVWIQLQDLHKKLFTPTLTRDDKRGIKKEIDRLEWRLIEATLREQNKTKELEKIEKMENSNTKPFFLWKLYFPEVFKEKGGFDMVVANPPYVSVKEISTKDKIQYSRYFETGKGRFNLFTLFLEKSHKLLKKDGVLTFILPEGLYSNVEYSHIRNYLLRKTEILFINLFTKRVFEASVDTSIISIKNKKSENNVFSVLVDLFKLSTRLEQNLFKSLPFETFCVNVNGSNINIIKTVLNKFENKIENILEIQQGIIYSGQNKNKVFSNNKDTADYKKVLDGRDVLKWLINWSSKQENKYILYTNKLHRPREERLFLANEKLLFPRRSLKICGAYDDKQYYALNTAYICLLRDQSYNIKFILSLLNSKLINYFYSILFFGWQITIPALNCISVPNSDQLYLCNIVNKIMEITQKPGFIENIDMRKEVYEYEKLIDYKIFEIYGLNEDEIKLVEGDAKL